MRMRAALLALALVCGCAPAPIVAPDDQWRAIDVMGVPVAFAPEQVGALRYRGGLELSAGQAAFGGLSGIEVLDGDRLVAINDDGAWFEARLAIDPDGTLIGVESVRTAPMRDENGAPFATKRTGDAEGLAHLTDGRFAVSFEQVQRVRIYDINRDGPFGAAHAGPVLAGVQRLPRNAGLEAIAATASGALLIGAEGNGATTPLWLAPLDASEPVHEVARYPLEDGFSLTALDRLPDGGYVALERFYAPAVGARVRITRFTDAALEAGGVIAKQELALIAPPLPVDNFEGVAAARMGNGVTRLYIVSDNNFNARQRTLLLAFDIVENVEGR